MASWLLACMQKAQAGADRGRDEAIQHQTLARGRVVAGKPATATTDPEGDGHSTCDSSYAEETALYIGPVAERPPRPAVVAQKAAEPVQAPAGCLKYGIAARRRARSLPALARQRRRRLGAQMLPYQVVRANAALTRKCRQIGATDSTWSMES